MDRHAAPLKSRRPSRIEPVVQRFAQLLRGKIGAERVVLFGSRARGEARADSDFDFIVVSPTFASIEPAGRGVGLWDLWYRAGGNAPLDLLCVTPEEFAVARRRISLIAAVLPEAIAVLTGAEVADETSKELPASGAIR